jgi:predicted ester cyclase
MAATPTELVERFYRIVWNKADEMEARKILDSGLRFRGSLGPESRGVEGFLDYLRAIHACLEGFTCDTEELVAAEDRVAARMIFHGHHRGTLFGIEPTGREIRWAGAAFFRTAKGKITDLWVLGDIDGVRRQLEPRRRVQAF